MLLVNGKKKENFPALKKAVQFELVSGYSFEDPNLKTPDGKLFIRKNKTFKLPTTYVAHDPETNTNVEYRYALREIPIGDNKGGYINKYTPDRIVFTGMKLICKKEQADLYEFLTKSPWLERVGNNAPKFKEIDPLKASETRNTLQALVMKAKNLILDEERALPEATLRRLLDTLSVPGSGDVSVDLSVVKDKLVPFAESNPEKFLKIAGVNGQVKKAETIVTGSVSRTDKENRLREIGVILKDPNLKKGFSLMKDDTLDAKLEKAEKAVAAKNQYDQFMKSGDEALEAKKFSEAKGFYQDALTTKGGDLAAKAKLAETNKNLVSA